MDAGLFSRGHPRLRTQTMVGSPALSPFISALRRSRSRSITSGEQLELPGCGVLSDRVPETAPKRAKPEARETRPKTIPSPLR